MEILAWSSAQARGGRIRASALLLLLLGGLALVMSAPCPVGVTTLPVSSTAEALELSEALLCSGAGEFEAIWSGEVLVTSTIFVSNGTSLKITSSSSSTSLVFTSGGAATGSQAVIDGGDEVQLFVVDAISSLELNGLSLQRGLAGAGAVEVMDSSLLTAVDCSFSYNGVAISVSGFGTVSIEGESVFEYNSGDGIYVNEGYLFVDGETSFVGNQGAAIWIWPFSSTGSIAGKTTFSDNNNTGSSGGALHIAYSEVTIEGETSFTNNTGSRGGAIYMLGGALRVDGISSFMNNVAEQDGGGGGFYGEEGASVVFDGTTRFEGNHQGAVYASFSEATVLGTTSFVGNTRTGDGGAVYNFMGNFSTEGNTTFADNTADGLGLGGALYTRLSNLSLEGLTHWTGNEAGGDGGAVYVSQMDASIGEGSAFFSRNSAGGNGGAIAVADASSLTIGNATTFVENTAGSNGGAVYVVDSTFATEQETFFDGNTAVLGAGGGIYCSTAVAKFNGSSFTENSAIWGGGLALFSSGSVLTDEMEADDPVPTSTVGCAFKGNTADDGGAMYSAAGYDIIEDSSFETNFAALSGGGFLHSGVLVELRNTNFFNNTAGEDGLAIMSLGIAENFFNVTFKANTFYCPPGEYGHDVDQSDDEVSGTCRFEVVCSRCAASCDGSEVLIDNADIDPSVVPVCRGVPAGVNASGNAGTILQTLDLESGHYRTSAESEIILECHQGEACVGGNVAGQYCATGYKGAYCAVCEEGYAQGLQYSCRSCQGSDKRSAIGAAVILLLVALFLVVLLVVDLVKQVHDHDNASPQDGTWRNKLSSIRDRISKAIPLTAIKTILVVWQIVTQFASVVDVEFPDVYEKFLSALNLVNFNLGFFLSFLCVLETNFYGRLFFSTLVPLAVLGGLAVTYAVSRRNNRHSDAGMQLAAHKHLSIALFIMFAVYSSVSFTIFQTFVCETLDNGVRYLRADYSLTCTTSTYTAMKVYAGLMVVVYPLGIPAVFAWWLISNRHELKMRVETSPTSDKLEPMKDLWEPYKPRRYYYEVLECGRRIVLTGLAVFIYPGSAAQVAIEAAFAAGLLVVFEVLSPFANPVDAWLYRSGALVVFFSMYLALLLKVDASDENSQSQEAFASLLVAAHAGMVLMVIFNSMCAARQVRFGRMMRKKVEVRDIPVAKSSHCSHFGQGVEDDGEVRNTIQPQSKYGSAPAGLH